jgi:hypothetical protein
MHEWRADPEGGRARLLADIAEEFHVPKRLMTHVFALLINQELLRPNPCAFPDLDAYFAAWRDALIHALCAHPVDAAAYAQARARRLGHRPSKANKAYALRVWRRMLARHWPTRA